MTTTDPIERVVLTHHPDPVQGAVPDLGGRGGDQGRHPRRGRDRLGRRARRELADGLELRLFARHARGMLGRPGRTRSRPACSAGRSPPSRTSPRSPPAGTASRFAVAGAETALWDLLGQARHATIAELLGASDLRIDMGVESGLAVGLYPSIVELIKTIEAHLEAGYRRVKIKIQPGQDIELVRAVRQHFGDVPLMVDANGAYTSADIDIFRELDQYDLLMFEQPMAAGRPRRPGRAAAGGHHAGLPGRDGREPRAHRRGDPSAAPAGSSTSRSSASAGSARRRPSTTSATSTASRAGSAPCPSSASARRRASTWRPCPTASTRPTSSPARAGSSTTTRSR